MCVSYVGISYHIKGFTLQNCINLYNQFKCWTSLFYEKKNLRMMAHPWHSWKEFRKSLWSIWELCKYHRYSTLLLFNSLCYTDYVQSFSRNFPKKEITCWLEPWNTILLATLHFPIQKFKTLDTDLQGRDRGKAWCMHILQFDRQKAERLGNKG